MRTLNIIRPDNTRIFLNDSKRGLLHLFPCSKVKVGDEVFWIDPCYWNGEEHTSKWGIVTDINGEIITLNNMTEVLIHELYI